MQWTAMSPNPSRGLDARFRSKRVTEGCLSRQSARQGSELVSTSPVPDISLPSAMSAVLGLFVLFSNVMRHSVPARSWSLHAYWSMFLIRRVFPRTAFHNKYETLRKPKAPFYRIPDTTARHCAFYVKRSEMDHNG